MPDARAAIDWYVRALGASRTSAPTLRLDGRVDHAELELHGATIAVADALPEQHAPARAYVGSPVTLRLVLAPPDADAMVASAQAAGAQVDPPPPANGPGQTAVFGDPFGHRWLVIAR